MTPSPIRTRSSTSAVTGRLLVGVGVAGLVLSVVAAVAGWYLVDGAVDSIDDSLALTDEALVALSDTIEVAGQALGSTAGGLAAVENATRDLDTALATTADVLGELDLVLAEVVPSGVDSIRRPIGTLALTTRLITDVLGGLALFGVDFNPENGLEDSVAEIDDELAALAAQLRNPDARLARVGDDFAAISDDLAALQRELTILAGSIDGANALLTDYEVTTERATILVDTSRAELASRRTLARSLVILLAALIALGQIAPIAVGRRWMSETHRPDVSTVDSKGISDA